MLATNPLREAKDELDVEFDADLKEVDVEEVVVVEVVVGARTIVLERWPSNV